MTKCRYCRHFEVYWNLHIVSKFTKRHQTCRIYWDQHLKPSCKIWAHSERLKFFVEKCWQCLRFDILWNFHNFSKFTKFHQTCRIYWDQHLKPACESWAYSETWKIFREKMPTVPALWSIMKFTHLLKVHQTSSNLQNILGSASETFMWNLSPFREIKFFCRKMLTVLALWYIMKFPQLLKIHEIPSSMQNILGSASETCLWKLSLFREVKILQKKCGHWGQIEILWNFHSFSKFTKYNETCRIYWDQHLKPACEIEHIQRSYNFSWRMPTVRHFEILWNLHIFSKFTKIHQTCRIYLDQHLKPACKVWAHSERLKNFMRKCKQCQPFEMLWNFHIFLKSTKFHEQCTLYWDQHLKPVCEIWAYSEKLKTLVKKADSAGVSVYLVPLDSLPPGVKISQDILPPAWLSSPPGASCQGRLILPHAQQ